MDRVNFGFKKVASEEKVKLVEAVFSSVAKKYDLMNDIMSFGIHRIWKDKLIEQLSPDKKLLDMASGTGDIAKRYYNKCVNPEITLCDINFDMLVNGKRKLINENIFNGLNYVNANAEILPFKDNSFDYYTIAFGIRNITNMNNALSEAYRVLKPNGKFICLEFSKLSNKTLSKLYDHYTLKIIPKIGSFIADDEDSYRYLAESIKLFPSQDEYIEILKKNGFKNCTYFNLNSGIAAIHIGYKN